MSFAERKSMAKTTGKKSSSAVQGKNLQDIQDFDLYLSEKLTPLLAQAMDALGRELIRQKDLGSQLDDAVRKRFNPRTWLAQYLLRNHPNTAQTPRRSALYADFRKWTDVERGRREILRRRDAIRSAFKGFSKKSQGVFGVSAADISKVFSALDQLWWLDGKLKDNPNLPKNFYGITPNDMFTFDAFWAWFRELVMKQDFLPFNDFNAGVARQLADQQRQEKDRAEQAKREEDDEQRRLKKEEEKRAYIECATAVKQDPFLLSITAKDMMLTGAVSSLDPENALTEVKPYGDHVKHMIRLLRVLGFDTLPDPDIAISKDNKLDLERGGKNEADLLMKLEHETWWQDPALTCWHIIQKAGDCEICDGVVDRSSLAFATDIEKYEEVKKAVTRERERMEMLGMGDVVADVQAKLRAEEEAAELARQMEEEDGEGKMSFAQLSDEYQIPLARIDWLHDQFKAFLEDGVDNYPSDPAALTKDKMRELYQDLKPDMDEGEFEEQFVEIDKDGSGFIEFDEFVFWLFLEEVDLDEED
jgi:Ca2+-binding EF-hand superfamily protein